MIGGTMRRAVISLVVGVPLSMIVVSCGPSEGELRKEEMREQERAEAERAVGGKRLEEKEREREDAAIAAYHEWFMHATRETGTQPQKYKDALKHVTLKDRTLVLGISTDDKETAIELCRFSLENWSDRVRRGISKILVVSADGGSTLAESFDTPQGKICQ
jgi:hypothetical protein